MRDARRGPAALGLILLSLGGCGNGEGLPPDGIEPVLTRTCTRADVPYTVAYPDGWHTNPGDVMEPCALFDPDPIEVEPATEIPSDLAVIIFVEAIPIERIATPAPGEREVLRDSLEVDGRPAIRREFELTEDRLRPAGTRTFGYLIDLDQRTLVVETHDVGDFPFDQKRTHVTAMVRTLELP